MSVVVRRAGPSDVDAACAVLADAFSDYPWTRWTVDHQHHRDRIEALQRLSLERVALPYGEVWVAVDDNDKPLSVAVWSLPTSAVPAPEQHDINIERSSLEGSRHQASIAADAVVAALRPTLAHYYLGAVGTQTDHQRLGLGTAALTPVLDRADVEGIDVYLETSALGNVAFYRRLGFVTIDTLSIADDGPDLWAMLRAPRSRT